MVRRFALVLLATAICELNAPESRADIISTTGAMLEVAAPPSLIEGDMESSTSMLVIDEGSKFMPIGIVLDVSGPGTYDASPGTPAFLPAGTISHTYIVHFDPLGSSFATATGGVVFEPGETIVGIQILSPSLDMSQVPPIPHPATTYPVGSPTRGFEFLPGTDLVTIAPGLSSASFTLFAELGVDQARIFTVSSSIPEPSSALFIALVMMGAAVVGKARQTFRRKDAIGSAAIKERRQSQSACLE